VDESEFRRRIEIYLEQELSEQPLAQRQQTAEVVARRVWPLVNGWRSQMKASGDLLVWIGERLHDEWPEAARRLAIEQAGTDVGFWPGRRRAE
jgi:hypothetical protein